MSAEAVHDRATPSSTRSSAPGGMVAVSVWIVASAGFAFSAGHFGSCEEPGD